MARWEWVRWVEETQVAAARQRRLQVCIDKLSHGERRPSRFNLAACTAPTSRTAESAQCADTREAARTPRRPLRSWKISARCSKLARTIGQSSMPFLSATETPDSNSYQVMLARSIPGGEVVDSRTLYGAGATLRVGVDSRPAELRTLHAQGRRRLIPITRLTMPLATRGRRVLAGVGRFFFAAIALGLVARFTYVSR
jgi:hypothetical protein